MRWITIPETVTVNPGILRSVESADIYFYGLPSVVTSGLRTPEKQLEIIVQKVSQHDAGRDFFEWTTFIGNPPNLTFKLDGGPELYWWQRAWSKLLNMGDIVNPPIPAKVLFDYWRPGDPKDAKHNKKGTEIGISAHMKGLSYDIGGGENIQERAKRILHAKQSEKCFIRDFLVEHVNNAVHVDTVAI